MGSGSFEGEWRHYGPDYGDTHGRITRKARIRRFKGRYSIGVSRALGSTPYSLTPVMLVLKATVSGVIGEYLNASGLKARLKDEPVPAAQPTTFAGTPATVAPGATSCRTTLPAPTLAPSPI